MRKIVAEISIENIKVALILGVYPEEKVKKRPIFIDVRYTYDITGAAQNDDFSRAIDYDEVKKVVHGIAHHKPYLLIETLAAELLDAIWNKFAMLHLKIGVKKNSATCTI